MEQEIASTTTTATINSENTNNLAAPSINKTSTNINAPSNELLSNRPEAVVRAMQILEVREQLERDRATHASISPEHMDDGEKALLREMCNVVWRKLEETPNFQFRPSSAPKNITQNSQNIGQEPKNAAQSTNWQDKL